jgi:hypothetical protein
MNSIIEGAIKPPCFPVNINCALPPEILTHIFTFLPALGCPSTLLTCPLWTDLVKRRWTIDYPIPERAKDGQSWFFSADKMIREGMDYHAFFYAIKIYHVFLKKIERPISPCTMNLFQMSNPIIHIPECSDMKEVACKELACTSLRWKLSLFFWRSMKKALNENHSFLLKSILLAGKEMMSEEDMATVYQLLEEKIREDSKKSSDHLNQLQKLKENLLSFMPEKRSLKVKPAIPRPHVVIACLPEESDDSSSDAEGESD